MSSSETTGLSPAKRYIPMLDWLPRYRRGWLRFDILAGITVWGTTVPTAMGYAQMAGLPMQAGIYAALVALIAYAVFGTSPQLKVETSPSMAILSAAVVAPIALGDYAYYITLSAALGVVVGLILIAAGVARMGFLADFLAKPVVTGFLFSLALGVIISQLPKLFGVSTEGGSPLQRLWELITSLGETNPWTLFISVFTFIVLLLARRYLPGFPASLAVIALSILAVAALNLDELGVAIVGPIPNGLPTPSIPVVRPSALLSLFLGGIAMSFVVLGELLGGARNFAAEHHNRIDTDQELLALGAANVSAGLMQGFSVGANPATTSATNATRAKTQIASIVTALLLVFTLSTSMDLLAYLPQAVVAVAVIVSVSHLLNISEFKRYYRVRKIDFALSMVTLVGVLVAGILPGLGIAVILSLLIVLYQSSRSHVAVLGKLPGHAVYGDIEQNPNAEQHAGLLIVRPDVALFFANSHTMHNQIRSLVSAAPKPLRAVIIDLGASSDIDVASTDTLKFLVEELREADIRLLLADVKSVTQSRLQHTGLLERIGEDNIFLRVSEAVENLTSRS